MITEAYAQEVVQLLKGHGGIEYVGVKTASQSVAQESARGAAEVADALVSALQKEATDNTPSAFADVIEKVARATSGPYLHETTKLKLAAAHAVDTALTEAMSKIASVPEREGLERARLYGREYVLEVMRGVL